MFPTSRLLALTPAQSGISLPCLPSVRRPPCLETYCLRLCCQARGLPLQSSPYHHPLSRANTATFVLSAITSTPM